MESANDPKKFSILGNYDNKIFWPVAILYGCIIAYAIIDPSGAGATFSSIQRFIIAHSAGSSCLPERVPSFSRSGWLAAAVLQQ